MDLLWAFRQIIAESWSTGALSLEWVLGRVKASASHKDNQVGGHLVLTDIKFFSKENVLRTIGEDLVLYLARSYSKNINPLLRTDTMIRLHLVIVAIILHLTTYIACPVGCNLLDHHYHADNRAPQSGCGGRRKETSRRVQIACYRTCRKFIRKRQRVIRMTGRRNNLKRLKCADLPPGDGICQAAPRANKDDGYWRVQPPPPHPREGVG